MTIENFIELFYIKAYLKNQDQAFMNLIEGSVQYSGNLSYTESSYHGFVHGNNIAFFAAQVLEAGLTVEKISHHIETLYPTKHNGSIKAKAQYQNKTYKEALYEKVKDKFDEITPENMSDILAQTLFSIIQDADMDKGSEKASKPREASEIVLDFTMTNDEKRAILNLCELIYRKLQDIMHTVNDIDKKRQELKHIAHMLAEKIQKCKSIYKAGHLLKSKIRWRLKRNGTIREPKWMRMQRWKTYLEFGVKSLNNSIDKDCTKLQDYCMKIAKLLENKKNINPNIDKLYELAHKVSNDKHICPESIEYSRFFILVSDFQMIYDWLQRNIAKL